MSELPGAVPDVVAVVTARNAGASVGPLVGRLLTSVVDAVVVVDNGSSDSTAAAACRAGARVVQFPARVADGRALAAGVRLALGAATADDLLPAEPVVRMAPAATPEVPLDPGPTAMPRPSVLLFVDAAHVGDGSGAELVVQAVTSGRTALAVGVYPSDVHQRGGVTSRTLATRLVARASGTPYRAPLSPIRAVDVARLVTDERIASEEVGGGGLDIGLLVAAATADGPGVLEIALAAPHAEPAADGESTPRRRAPERGVVASVVRGAWPGLTTARFRQRLLAGGLVLAVLALVGAGLIASPRSVAATGPVQKVVLFGIPHLGLDDLQHGYTPNLDRLVGQGAVSATSIRTMVTSATATEAYATIGAGTRVHVDAAGPGPMPSDSGPSGGPVLVPNVKQVIQLAGSDLSSSPGALGQALHDAHRRTAVVGSADTVGIDGGQQWLRPTALALMDKQGRVDDGAVTGVLQPDRAAPWGLRANPTAILAAFDRVLPTSDVVLVDPGDTERAALYDGLSSPSASAANRRLAIQRTDDLLGRIEQRIDAHTLLLVLSPLPAHGSWGLTPTMATGASSVPHSSLYSVSTKRVGLITITDIAPTILSAFGIKVPVGMIGAPLRYHAGQVNLSDLRYQDRLASSREGLYYPMSSWFILGQVVFMLLAFFALFQTTGRSPRGWIRMGLLALAAWPLATFILRLIPGINTTHGSSAHVVLWVLSFAIAVLASRSRQHALSALGWICGATVAVLVVDLAVGANLEMSSILGYSPYNAARFTGIGNTTLGILAGATVLLAVIHLRLAPRPAEARRGVLALLVVVLLACMLPMLGNKVGSILTLVPAFGLVAYLLWGRRVSIRSILLGVLATVGVLGAVAGLDLLRPRNRRTHLGRFVSDLFSGDHTASTTVVRKLQTNIDVSQTTVWRWMVPITIALILAVLVALKGWWTLTPGRSVLRVGVIGIVAAGLVGWAVNDSGVIVPALTWIYVGPFLMLLLVERRTASPLLLEPSAEEPDALVPVGAGLAS